jgi:hypothetical protein
MKEREMIERMVEIHKKEEAMLATFEALGKTIVELREKLQSKEFDIALLKEELAKAKEGANGKD